MIVVTGAAGFIASNLVARLNAEGYNDIVVVDDFSNSQKIKNLVGKKISRWVHRNHFFEWIEKEHRFIEFIFHIGARTDTTEFNTDVFEKLNLGYTKKVWELCVKYGLPLVYASSAATYGGGEHGYNDTHEIIPALKPLNPYGDSKNDFDKWVLTQDKKPFFWAGLKFFNVYGPNEYHKARMASVIFHSFHQIKNQGFVKLFRSHKPEYTHGGQMRDFIYVKDVVDVIFFLMKNRQHSGIYNLGTGKARSFLNLANATFAAQNLKPNIEFIDTPADIRDKYQYFTEANMQKLRSIGYTREFTSLEAGIEDYIQNYLAKNLYA